MVTAPIRRRSFFWTPCLHIHVVYRDYTPPPALTPPSNAVHTRSSLFPLLFPAVFSAQNFEETKRALGGFHFVAVQSDSEADDVAGFWLLKEVRM